MVAGLQGFPKVFAAKESVEAVFEDGLDSFAVSEAPNAFALAVARDRQHRALLRIHRIRETTSPKRGVGELAFEATSPRKQKSADASESEMRREQLNWLDPTNLVVARIEQRYRLALDLPESRQGRLSGDTSATPRRHRDRVSLRCRE